MTWTNKWYTLWGAAAPFFCLLNLRLNNYVNHFVKIIITPIIPTLLAFLSSLCSRLPHNGSRARDGVFMVQCWWQQLPLNFLQRVLLTYILYLKKYNCPIKLRFTCSTFTEWHNHLSFMVVWLYTRHKLILHWFPYILSSKSNI